jgi:hypothetical protein
MSRTTVGKKATTYRRARNCYNCYLRRALTYLLQQRVHTAFCHYIFLTWERSQTSTYASRTILKVNLTVRYPEGHYKCFVFQLIYTTTHILTSYYYPHCSYFTVVYTLTLNRGAKNTNWMTRSLQLQSNSVIMPRNGPNILCRYKRALL